TSGAVAGVFGLGTATPGVRAGARQGTPPLRRAGPRRRRAALPTQHAGTPCRCTGRQHAPARRTQLRSARRGGPPAFESTPRAHCRVPGLTGFGLHTALLVSPV